MSHFYSAFGMVLGCDRPLPGFSRLGGRPDPDLFLRCQLEPDLGLDCRADGTGWQSVAKSPHVDEVGKPLVKVERHRQGLFRFIYHDGTCLWIDGGARTAWMTWPPESTLEAALIYFLGPVMTLILRLRGHVVLHAAAVALGGRALLLAGPAGAGKSTTAAAFVDAGHRLLSDDTAAMKAADGAPGGPAILVLPDSPRLRLWPEASTALGADVGALPNLCADWDKRAWDLQANQFEDRSSLLAAVYLLASTCEVGGPRIEPLSGGHAVAALIAHAAAPELTDRDMSRRAFDLFSDLVATVPVLRVDRGDSSAGQLAAAVAADLHQRTADRVAV